MRQIRSIHMQYENACADPGHPRGCRPSALETTMNEPRKVGLALILVGVLVLLGNTTEALPPEAFFFGLFLYPIGGYLFFKGSRQAIQKAEVRAEKIRAPRLKNETAEKYAQSQLDNIETHGSVDCQVHGYRKPKASETTAPDELILYELDLELDDEAEDTFSVTSDVSFPLEVQEQDSLAEQIMKLQKLREGGIISEEEMSSAKAKLLG
jgi:hypothetical protein